MPEKIEDVLKKVKQNSLDRFCVIGIWKKKLKISRTTRLFIEEDKQAWEEKR